MQEGTLVLVNDRDEEIGTMGKQEVHEKGLLHRAFSVFIFNGKGELLLQQRALTKYHSAGLWTNTCCSHPRPGEPVKAAAQRRLKEEMGLEADLDHKFSFIYRAEFDNGLIEHEFDHVFFGRSDAIVSPDPEEVAQWRPITIDALDEMLRTESQRFTAWLIDCWPRVKEACEKGR